MYITIWLYEAYLILFLKEKNIIREIIGIIKSTEVKSIF